MKRVALLHTVRSVLDSFEPQLRASIPAQIKVHNMLDEFLASDPAEIGFFSPINRERLLNDLRNAELTGADLVVVTCSTLTPSVTELRGRFSVPIVAIDDAMCREAVKKGSRIFVLATARSTVEPTINKLEAEAASANKRVEIRYEVSDEAYVAIKRGDKARHDSLLEALAERVRDADVVVLAQASMAHTEKRISEICGLEVLSSPSLCIAEARQKLGF